MKPLEIHYKGKVLHAKMEILDKGFGFTDIRLSSKNGMSIYIFRKERNEWKRAYGTLADDLEEAVIDALILRFDPNVIWVFWWRGKRQVVEVSFPAGGGSFHININRFFKAIIIYDKITKEFQYHYHNPSWLKDRHMDMIVEHIKAGKVRIPEGFSPFW